MSNSNSSIPALRRLNEKVDAANEQLDDFFHRQARGEAPDGAEFMKLVERRMTAQQAMQAQLKLHEKPLKTVLNETH